MIISVGEILLDVFSEEKDSSLIMSGKIGGAPFNVAANISSMGGDVSFYGVVGNDQIGDFIKKEAEKYSFKKLLIEKNKEANTSMAMVSLDNGERSFSFVRDADYRLSLNQLSKIKISIGDIVHFGSLPLSEKEGYEFILNAISYSKRRGAYISFDANLRLDIFKNEKEVRRIYKSIFKESDIIKLSEYELNFFGCNASEEFLNAYMKKDSVLFVTYGEKGSELRSAKCNAFVAADSIEPIDSTGAGDAFYARVLKELSELAKPLSIDKKDAERILKLANIDGAKACLHYGAL